MRKAIREIEDCKILKEELAVTQTTVSILQDKVDLRDHIIFSYEQKDSLSNLRFKNYESMLSVKDKVIANDKTIETIQTFKIKTLRINKWIYGGVGAIIGIVIKSVVK